MAFIFNYWLADIVSILVVILTTIYLYFQNRYKYWKNRGVPYLEPKFPFGNGKDIFTQKKSIGEGLRDIYFQLDEHKYGGFFLINRPTMMIRDPELIKNIMVKGFEHFNGHGFHFDEINDPLSAHLFNLSGIKWRYLRTKLSPTFTSGKMKMMFGILEQCGKELTAYLNELGPGTNVVEVKDLISRYSTDVIASCAFGLETNCMKNPNAEFREWGRKVFKSSLKTGIRDFFMVCAPTLGAIFKIPFIPKDVTKYFTQTMKETIDYRERNEVTRNDFVQLLIELKNKGYVDPDRFTDSIKEEEQTFNDDHNKLSFKEVAAQAFVFYAAGFETSATATTFCLYELAKHPDIQTKLRNDIRTVLSKNGGKVTYDAVYEMHYLDKCVSEALRMYPPVPVITRECNKEYTIEETGKVIEKGVPIFISTRGLQHDPKYFPNPEEFNPENFNEESVKNRPQFVFLPFGEGPRICIGMRFGLLQVKMALISVLRDYEVTLDNKTPVPVQIDPKTFVTGPIGGMWLKISKVK